MSDAKVWVIIGADGSAIEILKNEKHAYQQPPGTRVGYFNRSLATDNIRLQVFQRDGWCCTHCGDPVTRHTGELHEREWRGRGGEISVDNSTTLCQGCHANDIVAGHGSRKVQWTK